MDSVCSTWKAFAQEFFRIIGLGNDYTRHINKFIKTDLEFARRENVIGMRCKAKSNREEFADPESSARGHSGEVCVNVMNPSFLQAQSDINRLIETEKIGAPAPLIESSDNFSR